MDGGHDGDRDAHGGHQRPASAYWALVPAVATSTGRAILIGLLALAALIVLRHRANIARIGSGTESKFGRG